MTYGDAQHEAIEYEVAAAWHDGYAKCLIDTAARGYELDDAWKPLARRTADQWLAQRLALFERCAAQLAEQMGRPPGYVYRGGPVPAWDPFDEWARDACEADRRLQELGRREREARNARIASRNQPGAAA